ncbi:MAG: M23 family metallopeptidase [Bacteroidota bacterium]
MRPRWTYTPYGLACRLCGLMMLLWLLLALGCGESPEVTQDPGTTVQQPKPDTVKVDSGGEPAPDLAPEVMSQLLPCDGFDFPVGPPNAKDYYKFRGFLPENLEHLGEDWNGTGGGNTDFGDYVYAIADGVVFYADNFRAGWGNVIRMVHNYGTKTAPKYIESLYAHVASSWVKPGNRMKRGEIIGTIGDGGGIYHAHLHFEMRKRVGRGIKSGYEGDTLGFVSPTHFIRQHRPGQR